jgi:hypothetical protein
MNALALGGIYVAVGNGGKIFTTPSITSAWFDRSSTSVTTENLYGVSYVKETGIYIAVGAHGTLLTSPDGVNWTPRTSNTNTTQDLYQVAFGPSTHVTDGKNRYVAVGNAGTIISSEDAATTWSQPHLSGTTENLRAICFGPDALFIPTGTPEPNSQFIIVGAAGTVLFSTTGADPSPSAWSASTPQVSSNDLNSIVPTDVLIAVGTAGTIVTVQ